MRALRGAFLLIVATPPSARAGAASVHVECTFAIARVRLSGGGWAHRALARAAT